MAIKTYTADGREKAKGHTWAPQAVVFRARKSANSTNVANGLQACVCDSKDFDPFNWYDATLGRFTPKVPGYYRIAGQINMAGGASMALGAYLRKNGSASLGGDQTLPSLGSAVGFAANATSLFYLNGSTDYVDLASYFGAANAGNTIYGFGSGADPTYLEGELVASSVGVAPEPWTLFSSFSNGFTNYNNFGYFKDPNGIVHFKGDLSSTGATVTANTLITTLPAGYRPGYRSYFVVTDNGGTNTFYALKVDTDGSVRVSDNGAAWVAGRVLNMAPVSFRAEG